MADYKKIAEQALKRASKKLVSEGIKYPDGLKERMHPQIEKEISTHKHSLGEHPIFPEGDIYSFEEKIMGERFAEVANRYKRVNELEDIDETEIKKNLFPLVYSTMEIEHKHRKELVEMAIKMVREEYDMDEDVVDINAELTSHITIQAAISNPTPISSEDEFDNHDQIVEANEEVYKRRFINAMIQGAAKKCNQMFYMVEDELTAIDPRLPSKYAKTMAAADYLYFAVPKMENGTVGGSVNVEFPSKKNSKSVINAQAMIFPLLIHELVKGVMELISANGLPKKKKIAEYVINKADFLNAELSDMRIGPALWSRFTDMIEPDDFKLKHHIYSDLISLPVREFNRQMKEIMAGTKTGKKIIKDLVNVIKSDMQSDELDEMFEKNETDKDVSTDVGFSWDELKGSIEDDEDEDGFDWDELKGLF
jgi:hypothetical protein